MRFSKPLPSSREYGRLSGSAQTRKSRVNPGIDTAASRRKLRKRKHMEHPALHRVLRQILHRVDEAKRRRAVARIEAARDHRARPSAHARENGHVLLAV